MSLDGTTRKRLAGVSLLVAPGLLLAAATVGARVSSSRVLPGFASPAEADYSRGAEQFSALRAPFIALILGQRLEGSSGVTGHLEAPLRVAEPAVNDLLRAVSISHPFTNRNFAHAYAVPSIPFTARTTTTGEKRQPGEPTSCGSIGGSAWYRYTPTRDLELAANTFNTNYSTVLGVFAGRTISSLRMIGCDTNAGGNAQVLFPAKAGTTYYFQVTGPIGGGRLVFNLEPFGTISRVSLTNSAQQADDGSLLATISTDGRYLAFTSAATNLVPSYKPPLCPLSFDVSPVGSPYKPGGPGFGNCLQSYVRDLWQGTTIMISVSPSGEPGNADSSIPKISADGRFVSFASDAANLTPGVAKGDSKIFLRDLRAQRTTLVSVSSSGRDPSDCGCFHNFISGNGRYVVFTSASAALVSNDTNAKDLDLSTSQVTTPTNPPTGWDTFVRDRRIGTTTRVSVSSSGEEGNANSGSGEQPYAVSISPDGGYVAFVSDASNLVSGDTNRVSDVFVRDMAGHTTTRVSVSSSGAQANGQSFLFLPGPHISAGGRYVVFGSDASNLVPGDTNNATDIFVHDLLTGTTERVSISSSGAQATPDASTVILGQGESAAISADGRYVVFSSIAANLVPNDTNGNRDVFLRDRLRGTTTRISISASGQQGNRDSGGVSISSDGRFVLFSSQASNLIPGDTNGAWDQFLYELPPVR